MHRRDIKRVWEFLKLVFRDVNRETVEYQRPRTRRQFEEVYEEEGIEQLVFDVGPPRKAQLAVYAECAFEVTWCSRSRRTTRLRSSSTACAIS